MHPDTIFWTNEERGGDTCGKEWFLTASPVEWRRV